jgi:predicted RNA binding protein YcfA (HicA-like mRNA interferase family)
LGEIPQVSGARALRALNRTGWELARVQGSHHVLKHPERPGVRVVVPVHSRPLRRGTLADILKKAGLGLEEFKELL